MKDGLAKDNFRCTKFFKDGNKACKSSDDCEGDCIITDPNSSGESGQCASTDSPFGCKSTIENYRINPYILCAD